MRPTTKDLAKAAGVSLATVDRVLNERPNVSRKTVAKVTEAIDRIGFARNLAAVNLARNKTYRYRFVLPEAGDQYLIELLKQIQEANEAIKSDSSIAEFFQIPVDDPHAVANYLSSIECNEVDGVAIMAPESPQVRDAMARLFERGTKVVQFLSGQENLENLDFVGIDNLAAGATAGRMIGKFLNGSTGKVMVIADSLQSLDSIERRLGFDKIINTRFPNLSVLPSLEIHGDGARAERIVERTLKHNEDIVAIYVMSSEARIALSAVEAQLDLTRLIVVAHERTPYSEAALREEKIDALIAQNPGHAVRSAIRILRARNDNRAPNTSQEKIRIEILLKENL